MEQRLAVWLDLPVPVRIRRNSRAKNIILRVSPDQGLVVTTPTGYDVSSLPFCLQEKQAWIEKNVLAMLERGELFSAAPAPPPERLVFTAFGLEYGVRRLDGPGHGVKGACCVYERGGSEIVVKGPFADGRAVADVLVRYCREKAGPLLVAALREVSGEIGLSFAGAAVRAQRTRWGSCNAKKNISLNFKLAFLPWELVRYVFVHELCHTKHLNHSKRYWALVAAHEPDWKRLDAALKHADEYAPLWLRRGITAP